MIAEPPYTPETLARRWGCSPAHVRGMIRRGELTAFRLGGKLIRISAGEVDRCESQGEPQGSASTEASGSSASGTARQASGDASRLARMIPASRGPVLVTGRNSTND